MADLSRIRIEWPEGLVWHRGRVFFVDEDGTETDISSVVRGVEIVGDVQDVSRVKLDCTKVEMVPGSR